MSSKPERFQKYGLRRPPGIPGTPVFGSTRCPGGFFLPPEVDLLTDNAEFASAQFGVDCVEFLREDLSAGSRAAWRQLTGSEARPHGALDRSGTDGRLLIVLDHPTRSQFDSLRRLCGSQRSLPPVVAVLSRVGTGFRGNRSRNWVTAPGNLHLSVMLNQPLDAGRVGAALSMLPVVTVAEAIREYLPAKNPPEIKWVNDVLVGGRKVAGLLTATSVRGARIESSLFGIGMNVATVPSVPSTAFVPGVTALHEWIDKPLPSLGELALELISRLESGLAGIASQGPGNVMAAYRRLAGGIGREVAVWGDEIDETAGVPPLAQGRLLEIRDDLSLRIKGLREPVTRGRLAYQDGESRSAWGNSGPRLS